MFFVVLFPLRTQTFNEQLSTVKICLKFDIFICILLTVYQGLFKDQDIGNEAVYDVKNNKLFISNDE